MSIIGKSRKIPLITSADPLEKDPSVKMSFMEAGAGLLLATVMLLVFIDGVKIEALEKYFIDSPSHAEESQPALPRRTP